MHSTGTLVSKTFVALHPQQTTSNQQIKPDKAAATAGATATATATTTTTTTTTTLAVQSHLGKWHDRSSSCMHVVCLAQKPLCLL